MRAPVVLAALTVLAGSAASVSAGPRAAAPASPRRPLTTELTELARTALASSPVRLPKGTILVAARSTVASSVELPAAPSRISIDYAPPARRAGPVTATAVLVFWKEADVAARIPVRLDLSVPPEALVYDVRKGGSVTLVVRRGLVEVSAPAVTSADADIGDVVQVLLRPSGRALRAQIVATDQALAVEDGR